MAIEQFEGLVSDLTGGGAGDAAVTSFWLVADGGNRVFVEFHQDLSLKNGDRVVVTGERDSQGTLAGTAIRNVKVSVQPVQPLQWGRVALSVVLSSLIGAAAVFSKGLDTNLAILFQVIGFFLVGFVVCPILTVLLVNYRRVIHTVIAMVLFIPVSYVLFELSLKVFR